MVHKMFASQGIGMKLGFAVCLIFLFGGTLTNDVLARGSGRSSGSRLSSQSRSNQSHSGPGTGSNPSSHSVGGHTRRDGTYVVPHRQSNPDGNFNNNWSTKPNRNPYTGKKGTRITQPAK